MSTGRAVDDPVHSPRWRPGWAGVFFILVGFALVAAPWIAWALIALPIAGVAKLAHNDDLARTMGHSLVWWGKRRA